MTATAKSGGGVSATLVVVLVCPVLSACKGHLVDLLLLVRDHEERCRASDTHGQPYGGGVRVGCAWCERSSVARSADYDRAAVEDTVEGDQELVGPTGNIRGHSSIVLNGPGQLKRLT